MQLECNKLEPMKRVRRELHGHIEWRDTLYNYRTVLQSISYSFSISLYTFHKQSATILYAAVLTMNRYVSETHTKLELQTANVSECT